MNIVNTFNTVNGAAQYRISCQVYCSSATFNGGLAQVNLHAYNSITNNYTLIKSYGVESSGRWLGVDVTTTIQKNYRNLLISAKNDDLASPTMVFYVKNLHAYNLKKAEVQDSDLNWAGRRTSYYEGTKMTSTDINVDSADTVDGGPVITVNTVNGDTPSSNPIGTSIIIAGTNNTNTSQ